MTYEEMREKGMDFFEKMITRLQKKENHREAIIVGSGFCLIGMVFVFFGS